jgi:hypothetical protein
LVFYQLRITQKLQIFIPIERVSLDEIYFLTKYLDSKDFSAFNKVNTFFLILKKSIELYIKLRFLLYSIGWSSSSNRKVLKLVSEILIVGKMIDELVNLLLKISD